MTAELDLVDRAAETLSMTRRFAASPERVFKAFTDPAVFQRWWGPEGCDVRKLEMDVRPGGAYEVEMPKESGEVETLVGTYQEVTPNERLVFTWKWVGAGKMGYVTLVTLTFAPDGDGTLLSLTQTGFPDSEQQGMHEWGWGSCFTCLDRELA